MNEVGQCPRCGQPMPAGVLAGFCPACLLAQGAETEPEVPRIATCSEPTPVEEVAKLFPQLEVLGLLGAGGMGAVYKARQPALDRIVALKILPSNKAGGANFAERFNREARALARLNHPNIVAVYEFGQTRGSNFFIMEYVDGANLRQLEKVGRLSAREALQIIPQICDALQFAHDEGIVHRDIKPENVLVDRRGRVKIADFGLAKILGPDTESSRLTAEGQIMGTPHYMAPEQVEHPLTVDHRADIYSLGVVFYEMLTGDLPIGKFSPPSRKVQVDVRLDEVVLRSLENDPERRYQHASEVKSKVETIAETPAPPVAAAKSSMPEAPSTPRGTAILPAGRISRQTVAGRRWLPFPAVWHRVRLGWRHERPSGDRWWSQKRHVAVAVGLTCLAIVFATALFRDQPGIFKFPAQQTATTDPITGGLVAKLPNGGSMELLALADAGAAPDQFWKPDGTPLAPARFEIKTPGSLPLPGLVQKDLIFRFHNLPENRAFPRIKCHPDSGHSTGDTVRRDGQSIDDVWPVRMAWVPSARAVTIRLGVPFEPWRTMGSYDALHQSTTYTRALGDPNWQLNFHHATERGDLTDLTFVRGLDDEKWVTRVVAIDLEGAEHHETGGTGTSVDQSQAWTYTFKLPLAQIKEFRAQIRKIYWVEFRDVALRGKGLPVITAPSQPTATPDQTSYASALRDGKTGALVAQFPGDAKVELLALGDFDSAPNGWWHPDGGAATELVLQAETFVLNAPPQTRLNYVILRSRNLPKGASGPMTEFDPPAGFTSGGKVFHDGQPKAGDWPLLVAFPESAGTTTMRVGLGLEPWRTIATQSANGHQGTQFRDPRDRHWTVKFGEEPAESKGQAQVSFVFGPESKGWSHRLVAVDTNGVEHTASRVGASPADKLMFYTESFIGLPLAAVAEFRLQVRAMHWAEFQNVALRPTHALPHLKPATFGPVQERNFAALIDFDTGRTGDFPPGRPDARNIFDGIAENIQWMQEAGFDAEAGTGQLNTVGMNFVAVTNPDWDDLTAGDVAKRFYSGSVFRPHELKPPKEGALPATFIFQTRDRGIGLLQLVAFEPRRPGATLRYKLVQKRETEDR